MKKQTYEGHMANINANEPAGEIQVQYVCGLQRRLQCCGQGESLLEMILRC